jgi:hypothetical protein
MANEWLYNFIMNLAYYGLIGIAVILFFGQILFGEKKKN